MLKIYRVLQHYGSWDWLQTSQGPELDKWKKVDRPLTTLMENIKLKFPVKNLFYKTLI